MKWITRERPKIDRLACPWLIKTFIDKEAEFMYVPFSEVNEKAKEFKVNPCPEVKTLNELYNTIFESNYKRYSMLFDLPLLILIIVCLSQFHVV